MPLPYDEEYPAVNIGAHRKAAPLAGVPGVTQHFAFWKPSKVRREHWHKSIDYFLFRLFMLLSDEFSVAQAHSSDQLPVDKFRCPNLDHGNHLLYLCRHNAPIVFRNGRVADSDNGSLRTLSYTSETERSVRYEFFSIKTIFRNFDLTVRAELRNEFWTLTFLGDLSRLPYLRPRGDWYSNINDAFVDLGKFFDTRISINEGSTITSRVNEDRLRKLSSAGDLLYDGFNDLITAQIIDKCVNGFPATEDIKLANIGGIFADFRGVILGVNTESLPDGSTPTEPQPLAPPANRYNFTFERPPTSEPLEISTLHSTTKCAGFTNEIGLRIVDALWPAIRKFYDRPDDSLNIYGKPEFTITAFQNRRAIYITSLGRLTPDARSRTNDPVRYTVISGYSSRWQIGRLIERIHNMGTLRLAAIQEIARLQKISDDLRDLYDDWQESRINSRGRLGAALNGVDARDFARRLEALGSNLSSGLPFRIERSAYYVSAFKEVLRGLRSKRLEGFQPYEDFVQRRMGGTFEFIQRIGVRYIEMRREIELALERQRTDQMMSLQESALKIVERISNIENDIRSTTEGMKESQGKTNKLLKRAELFLAVGTVFYGAEILRRVGTFALANFGVLGEPDEAWFYLIMAAIAAIAVWRFDKKDQKT